MSITIKEAGSGVALAAADEGPKLAKYEGNWYFDPTAVNAGVLRISGAPTRARSRAPATGSITLDPMAVPSRMSRGFIRTSRLAMS